jgi:catechol 2,3-dioxygenase-like lactoylglutathione lyase family enzyme
MQLGYVVIYVADLQRCHQFWTDQVGMVTKRTSEIDGFSIPQVGFVNQDAAIELIPNAFMEKAGHGAVTVAPSMCFHVNAIEAEHQRLTVAGVVVSPIGDHFGTTTFAFSDPEDRWFAVISKP